MASLSKVLSINNVMNDFYGNDVSQKMTRVYTYYKNAPAHSILPGFVKTVMKHIAAQSVIGAIGGAAIGTCIIPGAGTGAGAAAGAAGGAICGTITGFMYAIALQETSYTRWLAVERNAIVHKEILKLFKDHPALSEFLDPVSQEIMQTPVRDSSGAVYDYYSNKAWIEKNGRSPINHHLAVKLDDLQICYKTHGKMSRIYSSLIKNELKGALLTDSQKACVNLLIKDLDGKALDYYLHLKKKADGDVANGVISRAKHLALLRDLNSMLDGDEI